nr:lipocalin-like domain-containing protein [Pseudoroseicyclus aestuarii]
MHAGKCLAAVLTLAGPASAQGFAGLGTEAEGFALPDPAVPPAFPADHGAHPAFRIEWWYLTANLEGPDGRPYGLQWTLFRSALAPEAGSGWSAPQVWLGHAAVTTPEAQHVAQRLARGGIGQAGVQADPFEAWIDDWQMAGDSFDALTLSASGEAFSYAMTLEAEGPLVLHGQEGLSVKSPSGQSSYYYSQPFFEIEGTLELPEGTVPVTGEAWFDHEWSSQPLAEDQQGWDWFSLSFEGGARLMGFRLRGAEDYTSATWIAADGTPTAYAGESFAAEPLAQEGAEPPVRWRVTLPEQGVDVTVEALNPGAWMAVTPPYWEGPVTVSGSMAGRGYLEMTGYEAP